MVETYDKKSHFGQWFDLRGGHSADNQNSNPKELREWARSKAHLPAFKEHAEAAKRSADEAHKLNMNQANKTVKEHELPYWDKKK